MLAAPFRVVLDACVLYPLHVRDVLLAAAHEGMYQVHWSNEILDEATRNLVANSHMEEAKAARLVAMMSKSFAEAEVTDYEHLIDAMRNDPKDRHVVAAAVKVGAQVIVTENLRDFTSLPDGVEAQSADEFLCNLFDLDPERMMRVLDKVCMRRTRPPNEIMALAEATRCTDFVGLVRQFLAFRPYANTFDVKAIKFWGKPTDEMTVFEFIYCDSNFVRIVLPNGDLHQLERELLASLERNAMRQEDAMGSSTRWQLEPVREPQTTGPEELIAAFRVVKVSFYEAFNGNTIMIRFEHPGGADATLVHLTNEGAQDLLRHVRNRRAFRA